LPSRIVTVDIDARAIRLLQVQGDRVERWATASLEEGVVEEGAIINPEALVAKVNRLKRASGITTGNVIGSVNGLYSITRILILPPGTTSDLARELPELAREMMPAEDHRLLWQTMRTDGDRGQQVLAVWANDRQIDTLLAPLRSAGLQPRALEFKAAALVRAVNRSQALIVNLEPSSMDIALVIEGLPQVMRTVAVSDQPTADQQASIVVRAVDATVDYYNSQHRDRPLQSRTPLILVGPLADNAALRQRIEEQIAYPLEAISPEMQLPSHLPVAQYAVNIGLAMRQMPRPRERDQLDEGSVPIRINLMPQTTSHFRLTRQRASIFGVLTVAALLAVYLFQLGVSTGEEADSLKLDVQRLEQQVNLRREELNTLAGLENSIKDFKDLTAPWGHATELREFLEGTLTPGIALSSITIEETKVNIFATSKTIEEMFDFVEALRATGRFKEVPFTTPSTTFAASLNLVPQQQ